MCLVKINSAPIVLPENHITQKPQIDTYQQMVTFLGICQMLSTNHHQENFEHQYQQKIHQLCQEKWQIKNHKRYYFRLLCQYIEITNKKQGVLVIMVVFFELRFVADPSRRNHIFVSSAFIINSFIRSPSI